MRNLIIFVFSIFLSSCYLNKQSTNINDYNELLKSVENMQTISMLYDLTKRDSSEEKNIKGNIKVLRNFNEASIKDNGDIVFVSDVWALYDKQSRVLVYRFHKDNSVSIDVTIFNTRNKKIEKQYQRNAILGKSIFMKSKD